MTDIKTDLKKIAEHVIIDARLDELDRICTWAVSQPNADKNSVFAKGLAMYIIKRATELEVKPNDGQLT